MTATLHHSHHARAFAILTAALLAAAVAVVLVLTLGGTSSPVPIAGVYWSLGGDPSSGGAPRIERRNSGELHRVYQGSSRAGFVADVQGVAVADGHLYWATGDGTIHQSNPDGSHPSVLIRDAGADITPITVGDGYLWWTNAATLNIGRADLNGSHVQRNYVHTGPDGAGGQILVIGNYIYWPAIGTIARANLDGSHVDAHLIRFPAGDTYGLAAAGPYLYFDGRNGIARAYLDGTHVQETFIHAPGAVDLAVAGGRIYWDAGPGPYAGRMIGRADLSGSHVEPRWAPGGGWIDGLAASS